MNTKDYKPEWQVTSQVCRPHGNDLPQTFPHCQNFWLHLFNVGLLLPQKQEFLTVLGQGGQAPRIMEKI